MTCPEMNLCVLQLVFTLRNLFDDLPVERRDVSRFTTGNQSVIRDYLFVRPLSAGISDISLKRVPRS